MNIDLDMYQMTAVAVVVYYVGLRLKRRFNIFDQYCIPAPVIGGVLFSLLNLVMTTGGFWHLTLDTSLQGFFMTMFFTSIGYTASLRMLKEGGLSVLKLVAVCAVLIVLQNLVGIGLASDFAVFYPCVRALFSAPIRYFPLLFTILHLVACIIFQTSFPSRP